MKSQLIHFKFTAVELLLSMGFTLIAGVAIGSYAL